MEISAAASSLKTYLAGLLGIPAGQSLMHGEAAEKAPSDLAVTLLMTAMPVENRLRHAVFQVTARFQSYETMLEKLEIIQQSLPDYTVSGFSAVLPAGDAECFSQPTFDGELHGFSLKISVTGF